MNNALIPRKRRSPLTRSASTRPADQRCAMPAALPYAAALLLAVGSPQSIAGEAKTAGDAAIVDVQLSLCSPFEQTLQALSLRAKSAPFDVWLFDDPELGLFDKGLRLRLRGTPPHFELTLKIADWDCSTAPALQKDDGKCEYDLHDSRITGALSLTRPIDTRTARDLVAGRRPLAEVLSAAQKRTLQQIPGAWPLPSILRALGPARVSSFRDATRQYAVDLSILPGGQRFLEISSKVPHGQAERTRQQMSAMLAERGVEVCADQSAQAINKLRLLQAE